MLQHYTFICSKILNITKAINYLQKSRVCSAVPSEPYSKVGEGSYCSRLSVSPNVNTSEVIGDIW